MYWWLAEVAGFWGAQDLWSIALLMGYSILSFEYFRHGWMIHHARTSANISPILTLSVFALQCVLFVKGVYFEDWSLIAGALILNCGIVFTLYQTIKTLRRFS